MDHLQPRQSHLLVKSEKKHYLNFYVKKQDFLFYKQTLKRKI